MYKNFLTGEIKKWIRDPMLQFMLVYPLLFGLLGRYVLPAIAEGADFQLELYHDLVLVILTVLIPQIYGALMGFSILDDRDDNIISAVKVTPLSIHQFFSFKVITVLILSFLASVFILWFANIGELSWKNIISIGFLASLGTPVTGFLINAFSKNKIEGFAIMKGLGITIVFPVIALFFTDWKELIFAFVPAFWPAKAISTLFRGDFFMYLTFNQYYFIGLAYVILLNILTYRFFLRKTKS